MAHGSEWIKSAFKGTTMSALGEQVADLLDDLFSGIYHLDSTALKKVDWANNDYIELILGWHSLATYDNDELTRLVFLSHDRMLRCCISPRSFKYLSLMFHPRKRNGGLWERHPTVEQALRAHRKAQLRPTVVCLCGSTRFWRVFQQASLQETLDGKIVLSIGAASGTDDDHFGNLPREEYDRLKAQLDQLHLHKIDMADEVLILNKDGYIGESTRRELEYARAAGKRIRFLEEVTHES